MHNRFTGMDGFALRDEAGTGISDRERPGFRAALAERLQELSQRGADGNAEVLVIKDIIDNVFPGESYFISIKFGDRNL